MSDAKVESVLVGMNMRRTCYGIAGVNVGEIQPRCAVTPSCKGALVNVARSHQKIGPLHTRYRSEPQVVITLFDRVRAGGVYEPCRALAV